jgi:hypothetical protein
MTVFEEEEMMKTTNYYLLIMWIVAMSLLFWMDHRIDKLESWAAGKRMVDGPTDAHEIILTAEEATDSRTIALPDKSGVVVVTDDGKCP